MAIDDADGCHAMTAKSNKVCAVSAFSLRADHICNSRCSGEVCSTGIRSEIIPLTPSREPYGEVAVTCLNMGVAVVSANGLPPHITNAVSRVHIG